jgi:acetoin utilization protein AcuB
LIPAETLLVKNMMTRKPVTVPLNFTVGETAEILLKHNISGVPVVDPQDNVMGVISKGDLFRVLIPLTGVGKKGIQFALRIANRPGSIKGITDIIRANGGRIMSVLTSYADTPQGSLKVYIRMYGFVRQKLNELKEKISEKAAIVYMIDHRENKREIYLNDEH